VQFARGTPEGGGGGGSPSTPALDDRAEATRRLMRVLPFAVPFPARAAAYNAAREAARAAAQTAQPRVRVVVARTALFASAYAALSGLRGDALRRKVFVVFVDASGTPEAGIDAGGLFKELWEELGNAVLDPSYGLFSATAAGELYPNPAAALCSGLPEANAFEFVGRLLGKAMFEGITLAPRFARFYLSKLLGAAPGLHALPSLDPELYRSLMFLKTYDGDVEELGLAFTLTPELAEGAAEVELVPGGRDVPVTAANRLRYIHLAANWRLNAAIERQTAALLRGLHDVLPRAWLAPFSAPELQALISGSVDGVDVEDLRAHTVYAGYTAADRTVRDFWRVLAGLPQRDLGALLRFATGCARPPPLGFAQLDPRFTLQRVPGGDALPTSATCFNVLKLPAYASERVLRDKLLQAVHGGGGFGLS
jgi:ubiquitin-protein ligase E3 C